MCYYGKGVTIDFNEMDPNFQRWWLKRLSKQLKDEREQMEEITKKKRSMWGKRR